MRSLFQEAFAGYGEFYSQMRSLHSMVLTNCQKRKSVHFTVEKQESEDVTLTVFEQTLKSVIPMVAECQKNR